jgi:hypothetical protein
MRSQLARCIERLKERVMYLREQLGQSLVLHTVYVISFWDPGELPYEPGSFRLFALSLYGEN